jgi:hypothetical protein
VIGTDCIGIVVNLTTIRSRPRRALIYVWILDKNLLGALIIDFLGINAETVVDTNISDMPTIKNNVI